MILSPSLGGEAVGRRGRGRSTGGRRDSQRFGQVPRGADAVGQGCTGGRHRAARVVAQQHDQRAVQHAHAVLDAAQHLRTRHVARGADHEQVTQAPDKNDLSGQA
ncbi:hypothetical protein SSP35_22_01080 [Streptomyces sp. NBRC 110611]|nr:hypothetical protein SSP35_22_01080 [Streptomyces sp. NBRC 110611]